MLKVINQDGLEVPVKHSTFPAGEVYVKILEPDLVTPSMTVVLLSADSEQIMRAVMLADACENLGATTLTLDAPYLPYSRQDRACSLGESNSLAVILGMLDVSFQQVITLDVHNQKSILGTLVKNQHVDYALHIQTPPEGTVFVSPDKGAVERCQRASCGQYPVAVLDKVRLAGGGITQYPLLPADAELIANAKSLLIIDDICDGGATFLSAAKVLRGLNPTSELHLFVTHGIFSLGLVTLKATFNSVRCVNRYTR